MSVSGSAVEMDSQYVVHSYLAPKATVSRYDRFTYVVVIIPTPEGLGLSHLGATEREVEARQAT